MEIVTGKAGVPHVSSADDGRRIAGEVGTGSYVLQTGGKLAPSLVDANTVRIATGDMIVQGRHIGVTAPEDVKVASGSQGKKRMDYICVHYTRDVSGSSPTFVEKVEWKVLQGTPGSSAAAPSVPKGSILDGDADVTVPVCSVTFDGLTTGQPKLLIPTLTPLATLGDSVSQTDWTYLYGALGVGKSFVRYRRDGARCVLQWGGRHRARRHTGPPAACQSRCGQGTATSTCRGSARLLTERWKTSARTAMSRHRPARSACRWR